MTGKSYDNVSHSLGSTKGDHLLLFKARGVIERWNEGNATTMAELPAERNTRFNEAIANPVGRVFCGTMPICERLGRL